MAKFDRQTIRRDSGSGAFPVRWPHALEPPCISGAATGFLTRQALWMKRASFTDCALGIPGEHTDRCITCRCGRAVPRGLARIRAAAVVADRPRSADGLARALPDRRAGRGGTHGDLSWTACRSRALKLRPGRLRHPQRAHQVTHVDDECHAATAEDRDPGDAVDTAEVVLDVLGHDLLVAQECVFSGGSGSRPRPPAPSPPVLGAKGAGLHPGAGT